MERGGLDFALSTDKSHLRITTSIDGDIKSQVELADKQIDSVLFGIMSLRQSMLPEVPRDRSSQQKISATPDPPSEISRLPESDLFRLSLRHPGLGWLDWDFPRETLMDLLKRSIAALKEG